MVEDRCLANQGVDFRPIATATTVRKDPIHFLGNLRWKVHQDRQDPCWVVLVGLVACQGVDQEVLA